MGLFRQESCRTSGAGVPSAPAVDGVARAPEIMGFFRQVLGKLQAGQLRSPKSPRCRSTRGRCVPKRGGRLSVNPRLGPPGGSTGAGQAESSPAQRRRGWEGRGRQGGAQGRSHRRRRCRREPQPARQTWRRTQSRGIAQLSLPPRPRRRWRPGRCPPPRRTPPQSIPPRPGEPADRDGEPPEVRRPGRPDGAGAAGASDSGVPAGPGTPRFGCRPGTGAQARGTGSSGESPTHTGARSCGWKVCAGWDAGRRGHG